MLSIPRHTYQPPSPPGRPPAPGRHPTREIPPRVDTPFGQIPLRKTSPLGRHPAPARHPTRETTPRVDTPFGQIPQGRHLPGQTSPRQTPPMTRCILGYTPLAGQVHVGIYTTGPNVCWEKIYIEKSPRSFFLAAKNDYNVRVFNP